VVVYAVAALLTWPILDAAFTRYAAEPIVNAPARRRMPWVWCVLVGVLVSIVIGGLGS
jgi:predicted PurR-regulated permease PerM